MAKLTVYTDKGVRSSLAKTRLTQLGVDFDVVDCESDASGIEFIEAKGRDRVHYPLPQFYVGESVAWEGFKQMKDLNASEITERVDELNAG